MARNKLAALTWKKKCSHLLVLLAGRQGQAYEYGAVSMALRVVLNLVEEASSGLVMAPHQLFDLLFRRLASKHCEDTNAL